MSSFYPLLLPSHSSGLHCLLPRLMPPHCLLHRPQDLKIYKNCRKQGGKNQYCISCPYRTLPTVMQAEGIMVARPFNFPWEVQKTSQRMWHLNWLLKDECCCCCCCFLEDQDILGRGMASARGTQNPWPEGWWMLQSTQAATRNVTDKMTQTTEVYFSQFRRLDV